jgi:hypothetical protein
MGSLVAWFAANGRPEGTFDDCYKLTIRPSTRRMGGTKHFPAFTSHSSKLEFGRALR